jgi:hypothetical protein
VPTAVRGPVMGPACRACASAGEDSRKGVGFEVRRFTRRKNISAGIVRDDPDLWRGGVPPYLHDGLFQGQWCGYSVAYREC